jgi:hypothetical protein
VSGSVAPDSTATAQSEPVAAKPRLVHGNQAAARPAAADSTAAPTPPSPAVEAAEAKNAGDSPASPDRYCCQVSQLMLNSEAATEREQRGSLNYPADYAAVFA